MKEENSEVNRKRWSNTIIQKHINLDDLKTLIHHPHPVGMRFSWMLGNLCDLKPALLEPLLPYFFEQRQHINIPHFNRSLAKMFVHVKLPTALEGPIIDALFEWLADPKAIVTTKHYTLKALLKLAMKYPEIKPELKLIIETQLYKHTKTFDKQLHAALELLSQ